MGGSSSKSKQQSQSSQQSSSTGSAQTSVNVPDWLLQPAQGMATNINSLMAQGPGAYTPRNGPLELNAFTNANALGPTDYSDARGAINAAQGYNADQVSAQQIAADQVKGQSLLEGLSNYYNPFKEQVLNPTMTDYDVNADRRRAAQAAAAAGNRAFQGSRYGVQEAETEGELARGRAATEGGLLGQMYTQATGLSEADTGRRQQAALANQTANLQAAQANQQAALAAAQANQAANARAAEYGGNLNLQKGQAFGALDTAGASQNAQNIALQGALGKQQSDELTAQAQYPLEYAKSMEGLLAGLDPSSYFGKSVQTSDQSTATGQSSGTSSTSNNPGLLGTLGQVASIAGAFMK